jgi:xanthine dehydrogenase accessory factor
MRPKLDDMMRDLQMAHEPYVRATVVWVRTPSSGSPGDIAIVRMDGSLHGWAGGACAEPVVSAAAREVLETGVAGLIFLGPEGESGRPDVRSVPMSCASEGALEIFMEPIVPQPYVVIVGRSPAVGKLARLLAVMEWKVTIVDEEGKGGDLLSDLDVVSRFVDTETVAPSAVIVATQGHYDEDALEWAISTDAGYIGLVASPTRSASVLQYLHAIPISAEDIARVRAPTGIFLGDVDHEEIAVSVLAELVKERAAGSLRRKGASPQASSQSGSAVDPVCGMSVEIAGARFTHDHLGKTVYFCCPGCRTAFIADPEAFASV